MTTTFSKKLLGNHGEDMVSQHLMNQGYAIIARNYRKPFGEIDIIAQKDTELVFVEVKTRKKISDDPTNALSMRQQKRLILTAKAYIAEHDMQSYDCRFDAAFLTGNTNNLLYIAHAFQEEWY